ncbi:ArnT family glycosyltransferase [Desulfovibrio ferrophilus]|uniref:Glycosyl transferase family protein n=1 Tax=Desulfovibrio ferrophilus TaxID=241368 RepID=A0A2Z6AUL8_9BACT|nr:glycosyltransferase family 39 protein [Desulfovibrio ferrophilus]BBD06923.1 glycosyl transferase family protein [Desulfovibrio ferrophilus]
MDKFMSRLFKVLAFAPLLFLMALLVLQTVFALDSRALWFSDEIRYANVFEHVIQAKKWLVMYLNGVPYPDKPPVYFWFLTTLLPIFKGPTPALFMAGAALSGLMFITATCALSRFVLRAGREVSLGAGLILLTCFYFIGLTHYSRMDLLFASLITASHICLFLAWERDRATGLTSAGFLLAAVATLTKGPLGLVFPLLTSLVFLAWRGNLKRFFRRDVAIGFGLALLVLAGWIAAAWFGGERDLVNNIFYKQIYRRAVDASHHEQPFWHYFATLPAALLPWTFLLVALPLKRLVSGSFWAGVMASRKEDSAGSVFLWVQVLSGFLLLSSLSTKIIVYLMPLFPPLALLIARAFLNLEQDKATRFMIWTGGLFAFVAVTLPFGNFFHQWPISIEGLWWVALASALAAAVLWFGRRLSPPAALLTLGLLVTIWVQPLMLITLPSLDRAMSPKAQGELMGEYIDQGYTPVAYKIYSGVYTYYCGHNILETQDLPLIERMTAEEPKLVLGIQRKYWDSWENRPKSLRVVHEQWVVDRPYVLAIKDDGTAMTPPTSMTAPNAEEQPESMPAETTESTAPASLEQAMPVATSTADTPAMTEPPLGDETTIPQPLPEAGKAEQPTEQ